MLTYSLEKLEDKAKNLLKLFNKSGDGSLNFKLIKTNSLSGGGSLPNKKFPSYALVLKDFKEASLNSLVVALRKNSIPIIVRTKDNALILDIRTIEEEDFSTLVEGFYSIFMRLRR